MTDVERRVVLLAPFIHPYRIPLFEHVAEHVTHLHILVSTILRPEDPRPPGWDRLDVHVQRRLSLRRTWRHPSGFSEQFGIHIPFDTIPRLWRFRPDVVISTEMGPRSLQAVVYRLLIRRSRLIIWATVSEYNEQGRGRLRELVRRLLLRGADGVFVNGASGARYITALGVPPTKLRRVPYTAAIAGPQGEMPVRVGLPERLLYVGQLVPRKGLQPFVEVLAAWVQDHPDRAVELQLVGSGPLREPLERVPTPPGLTLTFVDHIPNDQLPGLYLQADVFAFPTLSDEWGVVVNEAMTMGLPVLGSVFSQAVEELVHDGTTGWTFRPDRAEEVYDAVDRALRTARSDLRDMGRRGQEAIERVSPEHVGARIVEAISAIC